MKRALSFVLAIVLMFSLASNSFATDVKTTDVTENMPCKSALLMEQETGKILLEKNIDEQCAPASLTKIMTMLLIIEAVEKGEVSLTDKVSISPEAKIMGGSEIWLSVGETMSLHDILKAIAVASANDGAVAAAEFLAGSEKAFVEKMNEKAQELKMTGTHYVNCHGLDEENHYTTARDVAIVSRELISHPKIKEYTTIWIDYLRDGKTQLVNTNRLIRFYKGATGLKTGTTDNAGNCLSATATRDNLSLIAVTMGCKTVKERFAYTQELLDYGFSQYDNIPLPPENSLTREIEVIGGKEDFVEAVSTAPQYVLLKKLDKKAMKAVVDVADNLIAPVYENQKVGEISIYVGDEMVSKYPIIAINNVKKRNVFNTISMLWEELCKMK